jgi:hypothetical protein
MEAPSRDPLKIRPLFFGGPGKPMPIPSPVLFADKCTLTFSAEAGVKIRIVYPGWDDPRVVLPGQHIEIRRGPQGVELRVLADPNEPLVDVDNDRAD